MVLPKPSSIRLRLLCGTELAKKNIEVIEMIPPALNTDLGGVGLNDAYPYVSAFGDLFLINWLKEQLN